MKGFRVWVSLEKRPSKKDERERERLLTLVSQSFVSRAAALCVAFFSAKEEDTHAHPF
jgi:hypothetical protein